MDIKRTVPDEGLVSWDASSVLVILCSEWWEWMEEVNKAGLGCEVRVFAEAVLVSETNLDIWIFVS